MTASVSRGLESTWADLQGFKVHFLQAGAGNPGRPVLMLHGWPQDASMWVPVATSLAATGRHVIAPDLRGFGRSATPGHGYDSFTFARDQVALLTHLGIERADIIGHDWGGWTAFILALEHPGRIGKILAAATPHPWVDLRPGPLTGAWRSWYAAVNALPWLGPALHRDGRYIEAILAPSVAKDARRVQARRLREPRRAAAMSALYRHYFTCLWQIARGRWQERKVEAELHLMFGRRDRLIPAAILNRDSLSTHAPQSSLEILPGGGHFLIDEDPGSIIDRALELFSS